MHRNRELYTFLLNKAKQLTEEWYNSLDKSDPKGVYASTDPDKIKALKEQNFEFHLHLCEIFIEEETLFFQNFDKWVLKLATDEEHLKTPIHFVIREFIRVRKQYLESIQEFISGSERKITQQEIDLWNEMIIKTFDRTILQFTEETYKYSNSRLEAQREVINSLSSPVITLNNNRALLPLVGEIDTHRAKMILENTLQQCSKKGITSLYIDLSGVVMLDTMVAQQIFQLLHALKLIGVKSTLSGIRPEIAQTAIQLGISFDGLSVKSNLAHALASEAKTREVHSY